MRKIYFIFLFTLLCRFALAQNVYNIDQSINVEVAGKLIPMPWAGGLNSAQINTIDLDQDGKEDLAVYDRTANKIFTYINAGDHYTYNPEYEIFFPSEMEEWVLLRDFNCDGKKDLFTGNPAGILVFINITRPHGNLQWRPFNPGNPLQTIGYNGAVNLQVNETDIPAIDDIDEDGDLDVIVARFVGFGSLEYHKNMSIENTGRCDSMQLKRITTEWGYFEECNCGRYAFDGIDCSQLPGGRMLHDAGKSLLTLDLNNDGLHDLFFSEQNCTSLYLLPNEGTVDSAQMNNFSIYPDPNPSTLLFPAAFFEDLDFDGVKDLAISTNISARVTTDIDLSNSIWFYKNTGADSLPQFNFQKTNWLQDKMIDAGSYASPAFFDYDNDGDLDLFISYWAIPDSSASIYQYENSGTSYNPSFKFVTNDYLQFSTLDFYNIKIQFADANSDGKTDLVFTATAKNQSTTQLYVLKNNNNKVLDFSGSIPEEMNFTINSLENILLYDMDGDNKKDILIGKSDGSVQYWNNSGPVNSPHFSLFNSDYLGLGSSISRYCASPAIADLNKDGKLDLLLGNHGYIVVYSDFRSGNRVADTLLINNSLKNLAESRSLSSYLVITTGNLYSNDIPLVVAGTITGGVLILKTDSLYTDPQDNTITFWPNPVEQGNNINVRTSQNSEIQIFNVLGEKLNEPIAIPAGEAISLQQKLTSGFYFARVTWQRGSETVKLIVH